MEIAVVIVQVAGPGAGTIVDMDMGMNPAPAGRVHAEIAVLEMGPQSDLPVGFGFMRDLELTLREIRVKSYLGLGGSFAHVAFLPPAKGFVEWI